MLKLVFKNLVYFTELTRNTLPSYSEPSQNMKVFSCQSLYFKRFFLLGAESADLGTTDDDDSSSDSGEDSFISNAG